MSRRKSSTIRKPRELLTPAALQVLLSLAEGDRHGYGIKLDVEQRTEGALSLGPGTLYEAIHRMTDSGWIAEAPKPRTKAGTKVTGRDARRRYYRLTALGRRELLAELERMEDILHYARAKSLLGSSGSSRT